MFELKSPLKKIRKAKALTSLPDIDGRRHRLDLFPQVDPYVSVAKQEFDPTPDLEDKLARELKDRNLAKRVVSLKQQHPYGTVPELLTLDWLQSEHERYVYQAQLYGGWRAGGLVPDFVVIRGGQGKALLINGNFWHRPGGTQNDAADKLRLKGTYFEGVPISDAIIVWESRLMRGRQARDEALQNALSGIEMGP